MALPTKAGALFAAALTSGLLVYVAQSHGEITGDVEAAAAAGPVVASRQYYLSNRPVRAECWQKGEKVIDENNLAGFTFNSLIDERSVSFRREGEINPSVFIMAFDESLCLVQAVR